MPYHIYHTDTHLIKLLPRDKSFYPKMPMRVIVVKIRAAVSKGTSRDISCSMTKFKAQRTFIYPRGTKAENKRQPGNQRMRAKGKGTGEMEDKVLGAWQRTASR